MLSCRRVSFVAVLVPTISVYLLGGRAELISRTKSRGKAVKILRRASSMRGGTVVYLSGRGIMIHLRGGVGGAE